jgi:hypothetical protein
MKDLAEKATSDFGEDTAAVWFNTLVDSSGAVLEALAAARNAWIAMPGGWDNAQCHIGICTRAQCLTCQPKDRLGTALAALDATVRKENSDD